ncbi:SCP2 sterol-binding domain-containing protein [Tenuibacillus multivorans]|uniref:Putative sterol carrier protein n=1 Tax=Tenuibacillus multivorans TaxID=237069 RepID=A0A1H0CP92_9BACI|nr:SCP2 sterol-binding domain-containing protein [Tenuibacillus multivorans]GEL76221.1 hypothetical protein TMU01_04560 [Tenuibacillus multivorans]SDN59668.1 Putative sterol carrier protein [Tenuibacillus multivorans]
MSMENKLEILKDKMNKNPKPYNGMTSTFSFDITTNEGNKHWSVLFYQSEVELKDELLEEPDCLLKMNESNFEKLLDGNLNATSAFMMGKIKAEGDLTKALKLQKVLSYYQ